jgi:hypothetical protein
MLVSSFLGDVYGSVVNGSQPQVGVGVGVAVGVGVGVAPGVAIVRSSTQIVCVPGAVLSA